MANDRMELWCDVCGSRITLAKHYMEEWFIPVEGELKTNTWLDKFFRDHIHWEEAGSGTNFDQYKHFSLRYESDQP